MSVTIATTIHYKGRDYASLEELPPEARADYQKNSAGLCDGTLNNGLPTRLIFNTERFSWPGHLPEAQRALVNDFVRFSKETEVLAKIAKQVEESRTAAVAAAETDRLARRRFRLLILIGGLILLGAMFVMLRLTTG